MTTEELKTLKDMKATEWNITENKKVEDWVKVKELKAGTIKWIKKDICDWQKNHLMTVPEFITRWMERLDITEEDFIN
ncbi:MAG: hypothetical protein WC346_09130 [Methanogenium sp.]|jgi:hypothetical protein